MVLFGQRPRVLSSALTVSKGMARKQRAGRGVSEARSIRLLTRPVGLYTQPDPVPPRTFSRLSWAEQGQLTSGINQLIGGNVEYHLNGLYAPGGTTGHHAYGYAAMAALYGAYKVHSVTVEIEAMGVSPNIPLLMTALYQLSGVSYTSLPVQDMSEQANASAQMLSNVNPTKITRTIPIYEVLGVTKAEFDREMNQYSGVSLTGVGANPPAVASLLIALGATVNTAVTASYTVRLLLDVEWFSRIPQAHS